MACNFRRKKPQIPQDVYDNILIELNKERIKDMNTLDS